MLSVDPVLGVIIVSFVLYLIFERAHNMKIFSDAAKKLAHHYVNRNLSQNAEGQVWVSSDGRRTTIRDMEPTHAKHALAMIVRHLKENEAAYLNEEGRVTFAKLLPNLVDGRVAFQDEKGHIRIEKGPCNE